MLYLQQDLVALYLNYGNQDLVINLNKMNININEKVCEDNNLSVAKVLALAAIQYSTPNDYDELIKEGLITKCNGSIFEPERRYSLMDKAEELLTKIIINSDTNITKRSTNIEELADKLREIYPNGKIFNTNYYYRCNRQDIINKLKTFFKMYGTKYTDEQIINATQKYVNSFNGNYAYLKLLKYFIWKDERLKGESVQSLLADFIENESSEDTTNTDWTVELK